MLSVIDVRYKKPHIDHTQLCRLFSFESLVVELLMLQAAKKSFSRRVDAPMSRHKGGLFEISQDKRIKLPNNVPLLATLNFFG
jgi:hypothetical protein